MIGASLLVVAMLVMVPLLFVVGGIAFAILGWALKTEVEHDNEGSPYIELNR